jgi:hypothetical protein
MHVKKSRMASRNAILSPQWAQRRKWIPIGSNDWPQMQCVKSRAKGWGRLNIVCNTKEKTSKSKWKHGMIRQANNQAPAPGPAQDLKHTQCE